MQDTNDQTTEPTEESSSVISTVLWGAGLLALGFFMIKYPEAVADDHPRKLIGKLLVWVWGKPTGIIALVIGAGVLSSLFWGRKKSS